MASAEGEGAVDDVIREKSRLVLELEDAKRQRLGGRRHVEHLATSVAVLESRIANWLRAEGRREDAVVSLISAASCLADARRRSEAKRILQRARELTALETVQAWIDHELESSGSERVPAAVFRLGLEHITDNKRLRIPQREAYMAARRHFSRTNEHAIIQLPVGCGKTGTMAILPFGIARGRVLVVTPNLEITRTVASNLNYDSAASFYRKTLVLRNGAGPATAILDSGANIHDSDSADFVVSNIQQLVAAKASKWLDRFPPDYFDMILIDEGHHNVAPSWQQVFGRFPEARVTSFTATPLRADGQEVEGQRIYRFPIAAAIREGYVRDLASRRLQPTELSFEYEGARQRLSLEAVLKLREKEWFSRGVALARECNEHIVDASLQCMQELRAAGEVRHQIIASACSIDHAKSIRSLYAERGYQADVIHSDLQEEEQTRIRHRLVSGEIDAIVHVQMLGEGADYPNLGVAAVFRPYRHMVPYVQFVGRVMRVAREDAPGHPDNRAFVVSHVGLNVDRWWDELKQFDTDDQLVLRGILNGEQEFLNPLGPAEVPPRRRFRPPMEVLEDVVERFLEVGFLEADAKALADDVVQALELRGVSFETLGLSREELEKRLLSQARPERTGEVRKAEVQPQRRRLEARRRLDERVRAGAKELLNELGMAIGGWQLTRHVLGHRPSHNLAAAIILINLEIQDLLGTGSKERDLLSLEELEEAHRHIDDIVDRIAAKVRGKSGGGDGA
jgi:superfamily II DNA or RNA helicase